MKILWKGLLEVNKVTNFLMLLLLVPAAIMGILVGSGLMILVLISGFVSILSNLIRGR